MEIKITLRMWKGQSMETPANAEQWALGAARQWAEESYTFAPNPHAMHYSGCTSHKSFSTPNSLEAV